MGCDFGVFEKRFVMSAAPKTTAPLGAKPADLPRLHGFESRMFIACARGVVSV
jgi:hypothetical protein